MLQKGVIEPCTAPKGWNSPIVCVNKKRQLEDLLKFQAHCQHGTVWMLRQVSITKYWRHFLRNWFGKSLFQSVRSQIRLLAFAILKEDRHKTAFQFGNECYQYSRLPIGLRNSGDLFCRCANTALSEVVNQSNFKSFVDDVCIYSADFSEYLTTLKQVLSTCRKYDMRLAPTKYTFLASETKFLGQILNSTGYSTDPVHAAGMRDMPPPTTRKQLVML